jgi:predicted metal-binding membrane protein
VSNSTTQSRPLLQFVLTLNPGLILVWAMVLVSWSLIILASLTGNEHLFHPAMATTQPTVQKLLVFLLAWLVMTIAMMLPTSLPLITLFIQVSQKQAQPRSLLTLFLSAYAAIWLGFAIILLAGDWAIHYWLDRWHWLHQHPGAIASLTLLIAGAFQFSSLKEQCMNVCRHPMSFLTHHYQRGLKAAWNLGLRHGLYCLGCCWALMLVMFGVGVAHLTWMVALTGIMLFEKTSRWGKAIAPFIGVVLLASGLLTLVLPPELSIPLH